MVLFTDNLFYDVIILSPLFIFIFAKYVKYKYTYWTRHNICQVEPSFPFGNTKDIFLKKLNSGDCFLNYYNYFKKRHVTIGGFYSLLRPDILVIDPDIIKNILIKDFQYFTDRNIFIDEKNDPLTAHLFALGGAKWRSMRTKLSPTFTSGKMKMMFHTLVATSNELNNILQTTTEKSEPLDIKDLLARFTTDVIGSCAFGLDCNSLKDPETDFRKHSSRFFIASNLDMVKRLVVSFVPNLAKLFKMPFIGRNISNFFVNVVKDTVKYREDNKIFRKDFLQMLMELKETGKISDDEVLQETVKETNGIANIEEKLTIEQIAAQCFLFFLAGFETSSTTMAYSLFELTQNRDVQENLRKEIITTLKKYNGEITYDGIMEMQYLDKVLNETLRKWPVVATLFRKCTQDYVFPNTKYTLEKGNSVRISVLGLHRDPEYYPNPDKFDPERFSESEKSKRPGCTYLPFGDGPRNCIGLRFGVMQAKVGLTVLLKNYSFTLNDKTQVPLVTDPESVVLSPRGGIWLDVHKVGS